MAKRVGSNSTLQKQAQRNALNLSDQLQALSRKAAQIDKLFTEQSITRLDSAVLPEAAATLYLGLLQEATHLVRQQLIPQLKRRHIRLCSVEQLGEQQQVWLFNYFRRRIYPLLTPLAIDSGHPFPYISSDSINLLILLRRADRPGAVTHTLYARLKVPRQAVPRLIEVPPLAAVDSPVLHDDAHTSYWVWSEDVIRFFVQELFAGMSVTAIYPFRILRAAEPQIALSQCNGARSLKTAPVVRLDVPYEMPESTIHWLSSHLAVSPAAIFRCTTPLGIAHLAELAEHVHALRAKP